MAHHAGKIDRSGGSLEMREEIGNRKIGAAILTYKYRGHPLPSDGLRVPVIEYPAIMMSMHLDESWSESKSLFLPNCFARLWNQTFRNGRKGATFDTHLRLE